MTILSIDLAHRKWADFGAAVLRGEPFGATYELLHLEDTSIPTPEKVAELAINRARKFDASLILLDGPQGWKDASNGLTHSRICERQLNTPGKTGLPENAKPAGYLPFIRFSIEVFDALDARGWRRFDPAFWRAGEPAVVETFPLSAWRSLRLKGLLAKSKARPQDISACFQSLTSSYLASDGGIVPTHDQLQAVVAGLGGLGILTGDKRRYSLTGAPASIVDGRWREGYIVNPV
jgi:hypothetical protein